MANTPDHHHDPYDTLAPFYDAMARGLLLPFGGEARVRRRALAPLDVQPGHRVLELGCGTGTMTRRLVDAGADVTALDLAKPMLARARRKVPEATFVEHDILTWRQGPYDRALLSFVLHEMAPDIRAGALRTARENLAPDGLLGVLDFAAEAPFPVDPVFRAYLAIAEPEVARGLLEGLPAEVERAGFTLVSRSTLALGTAQVLVARPG